MSKTPPDGKRHSASEHIDGKRHSASSQIGASGVASNPPYRPSTPARRDRCELRGHQFSDMQRLEQLQPLPCSLRASRQSTGRRAKQRLTRGRRNGKEGISISLSASSSSSSQARHRQRAMAAVVPLLAVAFLAATAHAADPFAFFDWDVTYMTASPLGVPQQVIAINKQFPGPVMNVTTNYNVVVNVLNSLDEPLLITWDGIQHRKNCWQDGVLGTTCPIPPGWNWTYNFQVKDQIGSFFYFPSLGMQRAAGGFGGITVNNRAVISVPFDTPDGDITLFIGDWYKKNHTHLRNMLDDGKELGMPDGVLMNGKGPYRYNDSLVPDGIEYETIKVEPGKFVWLIIAFIHFRNLVADISSSSTGKTYRFRVHNVGVSTSLNFRIQNHNLALVETEGSYTMKQNFTNLDIHVGQSYSFLVTMDQNASSDYYIVASPRFVNESLWTRVTGVAILQYSNSKGKASGPLPDPPNDEYDKTFSMNQARSIRMDYGEWSENSRGTYNKWDGVSRCTTQVFPGAWTAVMLSLDSPGFWNVRTEILDTWYLGQETYIRVVDPDGGYNVTEMVAPDNMLYCGLLKDKQKYACCLVTHGSETSWFIEFISLRSETEQLSAPGFGLFGSLGVGPLTETLPACAQLPFAD
nr:unnamed protein product [Digitaria exilis]